ncbi:MAG: ABC transporter substrate-binding protein [Clostridiales bacterium]|nr:ABC transporter substrate-binding protein [Clostridiales bacterium]MDY3746149.1 ABC transporter substrate-binding protein [Lachnospiraceae bacterium]
MKLKKILSLCLAGAMVLSLAACGSKDSGSSDNASADNGAQASSDAQVFKIGSIGPTTGGAAIYGNAVKSAIEIAVDEVNAAGGINGYQVECNFQDDEHDAEKSVNAYNTLKDWGMQILVGTVTSKPCEAVVEKTSADNMFQITPSATSVNSIQHENAFRMCFSDPNQGTESANYIADNSLATKISVIYDSSDTYSSGIYTQFAATAKERGLEIVTADAFTADSNTDFSVQIQKAKDAGADLLFLPIYYSQAALILQQADKIGYDPVFFGVDGMDGILSVENFDTTLAEGLIFLTPFAATAEDDLTQNFVKAYEAKCGETPNQFAADAYDCVYVLKMAIEKAGVTPDMSVSDICEALKPVMGEISYTGLTGQDISWTAEGEPSKAPIVVKIVNGAYELQ